MDMDGVGIMVGDGTILTMDGVGIILIMVVVITLVGGVILLITALHIMADTLITEEGITTILMEEEAVVTIMGVALQLLTTIMAEEVVFPEQMLRDQISHALMLLDQIFLGLVKI